jgi:hypothetical protein
MIEVVKSADGTTLGKRSLWSRDQTPVASTSATVGHTCPSQCLIQTSRTGAEADTPERSQSDVPSLTRPSPAALLLGAFLHWNTH